MTGSLCYIFSSLIVMTYLILQWKKEKQIKIESPADEAKTIGKESLSDIILKWVVAIFAFMFTFISIAIALICIYALPDQSAQPLAGALFLMSGFVVMSSFVWVVWKNWVSSE